MRQLYKASFYFAALCAVLIYTQGCNVINPAEDIPTYVHIDSFHFAGKGSSDIKCMWVYYNNNPVGAFDLPANVPIITKGNQGTMQIEPGILINGLNSRPVAYPFYKLDISTLTTNPGKITNYTPTTTYYDSVRTTIISDFEAGITKFAKANGNVQLAAVTADSLVYEGTGSGAIYLTNAADSSVDSTMTTFVVPTGAAFIEVDYKSSLPFALGMQANLSNLYTSDISWVGINANNTKWNKFYYNITDFVVNYPADSYTLFIKTFVPIGSTGGRVLIDNIKLVTF